MIYCTGTGPRPGRSHLTPTSSVMKQPKANRLILILEAEGLSEQTGASRLDALWVECTVEGLHFPLSNQAHSVGRRY